MDKSDAGQKKRKTIDEKSDEFIKKVLENPEEFGIDPEKMRRLWEDVMKKNLTRKSKTDREPIYG